MRWEGRGQKRDEIEEGRYREIVGRGRCREIEGWEGRGRCIRTFG